MSGTLPAPVPTVGRVKSSESADAAREWSVEVVTDRIALQHHQDAWTELAEVAAERNVFFEPWMFLPAAAHFEPATPLQCVFVYRRGKRPDDPRTLCGFFPFEVRRRYRGLPIRTLRLWDPALVLYTPLVHRDWGRDALRQLFDWVASERWPLVELPMINGDGPFQEALVDVLNERRIATFVDEVVTRAFFRRGADAESYCAAAVDKESRRNWRRLRRRMSEHGRLETRVLQPGDDAGRWIEQFLSLEAAGWKGKERTALAAIPARQAIFRAAGRNAFALGKLQMLGLFLDDRPVALKCNYLCPPGGFTYKIAYDEAFAKFSPGVLLELDNIELAHRAGIEWLDSCAAPDHFMMNRLWTERRVLQSLTLATSRWVGNAIVGALPMLRAVRRMFRR